MDDTKKLERELAELRGEVEALRARLDESQKLGRLTMRGHKRCPDCGETKILFADRVRYSGAYATGAAALCLGARAKWAKKLQVHGQLQLYVCTSCCAAEWYVKDLKGVEPNETEIRILDEPERDTGPYR